MAAADPILHDPLTINLGLEVDNLLARLGHESHHAQAIKNASSRADLLRRLSALLSTPGLTLLVATVFRPILLDLCARFLEDQEDQIAKLEALCLLLGLHPEVYPCV